MATTPGFTVNFKPILEQLKNDMNGLSSALATHIDKNIIDKKFMVGFPGHELQKSTIRRKGNNTIGEESGALRRAATSWNNWEVYPFEPGTIRKQLEKKKSKLTYYASMVKTKIGGELDILGLEAEDVVSMENFVKNFMQSKKYAGNGKIKVIQQ